MTRLLIKNLLLTLLLSFVSSGFLFFICYAASNPGFEKGQGLFMIFAVAEIFQHLFLFLAALPVLSIDIQTYLTDKASKLVRYFGGPVAYTILSILVVVKAAWFDELILLLIPNLTFLLLHLLFYLKLPKEINE